MFSFCFEINLQTLRSERINVAAGHRSIDFKTKSCKKINVPRTGTYVIVCVLKSFLGPSWSSCLAIMAMKPWMDLVKKHEKVESGPPAKVLCTPL